VGFIDVIVLRPMPWKETVERLKRLLTGMQRLLPRQLKMWQLVVEVSPLPMVVQQLQMPERAALPLLAM